MLFACAREIEDGDVVVAGQGFPTIAAILAKKFFAPHVTLLTEAGIVDFVAVSPPATVGDVTAMESSAYSCDMLEVFETIVYRGYVDVSILGIAQVDRYGNVNSTVIGDRANPKRMLAGGGGAPELMAYSRKTLLTARSGQIVEHVDYLTSPGYLSGGSERAASPHFHIPGGPSVLATTRGLFRFDPETRELYLAALMPGETVASVQAKIPWQLKVSPELTTLEPPSEDQVLFLRRFAPAASLGRTGVKRLLSQMSQRLAERPGT